MDRINVILLAQRALKLINDTEEEAKLQGLESLERILDAKDKKLAEYGYDQVIFKGLTKLTKFESGQTFNKTLKLLEIHYYSIDKYHDQMAEALLYRYGLDGDVEINRICLQNMSALIDNMGDNVAKHSKQILKVADLNNIPSLNPIITEILIKIKNKVPIRISSSLK